MTVLAVITVKYRDYTPLDNGKCIQSPLHIHSFTYSWLSSQQYIVRNFLCIASFRPCTSFQASQHLTHTYYIMASFSLHLTVLTVSLELSTCLHHTSFLESFDFSECVMDTALFQPIWMIIWPSCGAPCFHNENQVIEVFPSGFKEMPIQKLRLAQF